MDFEHLGLGDMGFGSRSPLRRSRAHSWWIVLKSI